VVAGVLDGQSDLDAFKADDIAPTTFSTREKMIVPFHSVAAQRPNLFQC
jgi:hypothetical protein